MNHTSDSIEYICFLQSHCRIREIERKTENADNISVHSTCSDCVATQTTTATNEQVSFKECYPNSESAAQDKLIQRLNQLVEEFAVRCNRTFSYDIKVRWKVDRENQLKFSVTITNKPPIRLS